MRKKAENKWERREQKNRRRMKIDGGSVKAVQKIKIQKYESNKTNSFGFNLG